MFSGLAGKLKDTVRIGLAGLFAGLMGGLRGNGDGDWASQDADDWSDGILSDSDGTFWESGEIRLAASYEQGNYRFSIRDGGAVSSFLCAYEEYWEDETSYGRFISTEDGQIVFFWNFWENTLTWYHDGQETVFTQIIDPLDGSEWVSGSKALKLRWLGDQNYSLTIEQPLFTAWSYQGTLDEETGVLKCTGEKIDYGSVLYTDASASFAFNENRTHLTWTDEKEPDALEGLVFDAVPADLMSKIWNAADYTMAIFPAYGSSYYDISVYSNGPEEEDTEIQEETPQDTHSYLCAFDWENSVFTSLDISRIDLDALQAYIDPSQHTGSATFALLDDTHMLWQDDAGLTGEDGIVLEADAF